jgi:hypothetical protein
VRATVSAISATFSPAKLLACLMLLFGLTAGVAEAARNYVKLTVADPYLELRTGPHSGYPIYQIADRGETVEVIKRRTDWYKVRTVRGYKGWVARDQLARTLLASGDEVVLASVGIEQFSRRRFEAGAMTGDFGGANLISIYGSLGISPNLSIEMIGSQALGNVSNSLIGQGRRITTFFPEWWVSPYFGIGGGVISVSPNATLVQVEDRVDPLASASLGLRTYLSRNFMLRAEYTGYVVFTEREENEEIYEWKLGFAFFF